MHGTEGDRKFFVTSCAALSEEDLQNILTEKLRYDILCKEFIVLQEYSVLIF